MHAPEPLYPFDAVVLDYAVVAFNQASSRLFVLPPSLGLESRILNGYVYVSAELGHRRGDARLARGVVPAARRLLLRALG